MSDEIGNNAIRKAFSGFFRATSSTPLRTTLGDELLISRKGKCEAIWTDIFIISGKCRDKRRKKGSLAR